MPKEKREKKNKKSKNSPSGLSTPTESPVLPTIDIISPPPLYSSAAPSSGYESSNESEEEKKLSKKAPKREQRIKERVEEKERERGGVPISPWAVDPRTAKSASSSSQTTNPHQYESSSMITTTIPQLTFDAITKYFAEGNTRVENERRARAMGLANGRSGVRVAPGANIRLAEGIKLGDKVYIGLFTYINGEVYIGSEVTIGPQCTITSNNHMFNPESQSFQGRNENKPIHINRGTWIAAGCTITAGSNIGECCLVCAGSVVTHDFPDYAIVAGIPAKIVGSIDPATGEKLWNSNGGESSSAPSTVLSDS